jgi:hypothetical protein
LYSFRSKKHRKSKLPFSGDNDFFDGSAMAVVLSEMGRRQQAVDGETGTAECVKRGASGVKTHKNAQSHRLCNLWL